MNLADSVNIRCGLKFFSSIVKFHPPKFKTRHFLLPQEDGSYSIPSSRPAIRGR